jgi:hypothetical protein
MGRTAARNRRQARNDRMTAAERVAVLRYRRENIYREALRIAVAEPFALAESVAYDRLLEKMEAINELIHFEENHHVTRNRKENCCKQVIVESCA